MLKTIHTHLRALAAALVLVAGLGVTTLHVQSASAATVDVLAPCKKDSVKSTVCKGADETSLNSLMQNVINLLITIIGIISVIMIIVGGIRYTTSGGDAGQTKSARDTIIYAVVGLVVAIMAYAIVNFVLSRL